MIVIVVVLGAITFWAVVRTTGPSPDRSDAAVQHCHDLVQSRYPTGSLEPSGSAVLIRNDADVYEVRGTVNGEHYDCVMHWNDRGVEGWVDDRSP